MQGKPIWGDCVETTSIQDHKIAIDHGRTVEFKTIAWRRDIILDESSTTFSRDEAIAAARAILKHFDVE